MKGNKHDEYWILYRDAHGIIVAGYIVDWRGDDYQIEIPIANLTRDDPHKKYPFNKTINLRREEFITFGELSISIPPRKIRDTMLSK